MAASKGIGSLVQIAAMKEVTRGTAVTGGGYWIPNEQNDPESKITNVTDEQIYGVIEDSISQSRVKNWMEGSIKANVRDTHFGLILKALFGTENVSTHAGETVVYDHKFTVQEGAQHPTVTFMKHDPLAAQDYTYANGVVHKLDLEYSLGKFITYNASIKAQAGVQSVTLSPSTTSENDFVAPYMTFKLASALSGLAGASAIQVKSAKITFDETIEDQDVLGNASPADFLNKEFKAEATIEAIWKGEADFFTAYIANTPQAYQFDLINSGVTIGSATNPELKIRFAKGYMTELTKPYKKKDLVYQTVKIKFVYSASDTEMCDVTLTNLTTTSY